MTVPNQGAFPDDVRLEVTDRSEAEKTRQSVKVGHRFVFADGGVAAAPKGRRARLLGYKRNDARQVLPLHEPVDLPGLRVIPHPLDDAPLACLVTDRDLYRAELDTVHLYIAAPSRPTNLKLEIMMEGQPLTERELDDVESLREHGVAIEHLAMLTPGSYTARLLQGERPLALPVKFTVAEYKLAPLSARLARHSLDRARNELSFVLGVESFQQKYDRPLEVELLDGGQTTFRTTVTSTEAGRYEGVIPLVGVGPFRLRLTAADDAERTAEVVIPGTRVHERQATVISELGQEVLFSMMPEPGSIPVRGAHLTEGDFLGTPIVIDSVIAARARLEVREDIESLVTITHDLVSGKVNVVEHADQKRGNVIELDAPSAMSTIYVGCFIDHRPFEAYSHVLRPDQDALSLEVPDVVRPSGEVAIRLSAPAGKVTPVLLSIRDRRLTQADKPQAALNSSLKSAVDRAVAGFDTDFSWLDLAEDGPWRRLGGWTPPPRPAPRPAPRPLPAATPDFNIAIQEKNGPRRVERFTQNEVTIGRVQGNDIVLPKGNISKRHARIVLRDGKYIIVDLRSTNGTYVNGKRINAPQVLKDSDKIYIGDFTLTLDEMYAEEGFEDSTLVLNAAEPQASPAPPAMLDDVPTGAGAAVESDEMLYDVDEDSFGDLEDIGEMDDIAFGEESVELSADALEDFDDEPDIPVEAEAPSQFIAPAGDKGGALVKRQAPEPDVRRAFPEVLFFGLVEVSGDTTITLPVGDQLGTFAVEAFAVGASDWSEAEATLVVDQPVRADLRVPTAVFPGDKVQGRLRAFAGSGRVKVSLTRDNDPVALKQDGRALPTSAAHDGPLDLTFDVVPGRYVATVEDPASGEIDVVEVWVDEPRAATSMVRELRFLRAGQSLSLDEADAISLRVLPGIDAPFDTLVRATAGYGHLCCEQTASKIVSAVAMYLSASTPKDKALAEDIIISGVAREETMLVEGGFSMYPNTGGPNDYWGAMVPSRLWQLEELRGVPGVSAGLRRAVERGVDLAEYGARAYGIRRVPDAVTTCEEAYRVARSGNRARDKELLGLIKKRVKLDNGVAVMRDPQDKVRDRAELGYAAATLLLLEHVPAALKVADAVLRQLNSQGRLYSTVDSVAAIALLAQLRRVGALGDPALVVDGEPMTGSRAMERADQLEHLEVKDGVCAVEVTRLLTEDWREFKAAFPLRVGFRDPSGQKLSRFAAGDRATLLVELADGYEAGDLVHVVLPPALVWLHGGGQLQRFSVDFRGRDRVEVPVVCAADIEGRQHFALCVRNMFREERASCPGLLKIEARA
jgi:hypothetical protein